MNEQQTDPLPDFAVLSQVRAPASLHASIEHLIDAHGAAPRRSPRRRLRFVAAPALLIAGALALVLALSGGSTAPTVPRAAAFATRPATSASPAENPRDHDELLSSVDGVAYPYWGEQRLGWRTAGVRTDTLGGHMVTTVFYANSRAQRIGYSIVSGSPLPAPGGRVWNWSGVRYHLLNVAGTPVVAWERQGHTCILAGAVSAHTLLRLAARET
ncbi:MAG TPA: hypothetical protein VLJ42_11195 [Solirubrobacteraceae bacterium]|nr:hypothetical protein [Solirubrobacteraceae bacterium]